MLYKKDWGAFSLGYITLIDHVISQGKSKVQSVLDVGCGTGDLLNELDGRGYELYGLDLSNEMINIAKEKNSNIDLQVADIKKFNYNRQFDLIISSFDVMNYVTNPQELSTVFHNIRRHLSQTGHLIFDFNTVDLYQERHHGTIKRSYEEAYFEQKLTYDEDKRIAKTRFIFEDGFEEEHIQYAYTYEEVKTVLENAGFTITYRYKNLALDPCDDKTYKMFIVATISREQV